MRYLPNGYLEVEPSMIGCLIVHDNGFHEAFYEPTDEEISAMCYKYNFDYAKTMELISKRQPGTHTIIFQVERYRAYLRGEV